MAIDKAPLGSHLNTHVPRFIRVSRHSNKIVALIYGTRFFSRFDQHYLYRRNVSPEQGYPIVNFSWNHLDNYN